MASSSSPNLSRSNTFSATKQYSNVRFQQGVPILDVDLNDAQDYVQHQSALFRQSLTNWAASPTSSYEATVRPVTNANDGRDDRNVDNSALTLGRISTRLGVIDNYSSRENSLYDFIVYDYSKIEALEVETSFDRPYANALFTGTVTATNGSTYITDANKYFTADHRLAGFTHTLEIPGGTPGSPMGATTPSGTVGPTTAVITEGPCRIVFHTLSGYPVPSVATVEITAVASATRLDFEEALPTSVAVGDTYSIIPANTLTDYRERWNAELTLMDTFPFGLGTTGLCLHYVQAFLEDISSEEDEDIKDPTLGMETTHRTQLRFAYRIAMVNLDTNIAQIHAYNLLTNKDWGLGSVPYIDRLSDTLVASPATAMDGTDNIQAWADYSTGSRVGTLSDLGPGYFNRGEYMLSSQGKTVSIIKDIITGVFDWFTSDTTRTCHVPLVLEAGPVKTPTLATNAQYLSQFWFPNLEHNIPTGYLARLNFNQTFTGGVTSSFWQDLTFSQPFSIPEIASDVAKAKSVTWHANDAFTFTDYSSTLSGKLRENRTSVKPALTHPSLASHISWVDSLLLGSLGLGNQMASFDPHTTAFNSLYTGSNLVLPTNLNWIPRIDETNNLNQPLLSSGQNIDPELRPTETNWLLNSDGDGENRLIGTVHPPDILSGSVMSNSYQWGSTDVASVTGPGEYKLRSGETITVDSAKGWSFYRKENENYNLDNTAGESLDMSIRQWHEGLGQATNFQNSLAFRKLAIKTTAHKEMDMFTISFRPPTIISQPATNAAGSDWDNNSVAGATQVSNWLDPEGYGYCAIGMVINPTLQFGSSDTPAFNPADTTAFGQTSKTGIPYSVAGQSYHVGGYYSEALALPDLSKTEINGHTINYDSVVGNSAFSLGDMVMDSRNTDKFLNSGGTVAYEAAWWKGTLADFDKPGLVSMDLSLGAWSRWSLTPRSTGIGLETNYALRDQWENRCTSMRVRYHIGDYYPGPQATDVDGNPVANLYTNALVDTLNMFVRFEPLSLTHWMTMPKHQHSVMEGSFSFSDGLRAALEYSQMAMRDNSLLDGSGNPLVTPHSPILHDEEYIAKFGAPSVGDIDSWNTPFEYAHHMNVHWYHPYMHKVEAPFPWGSSYTGGPKTPDPAENNPVPYHRFGERSLVSVGVTYNKPRRYDIHSGSVYTDTFFGTSNPEIIYAATLAAPEGNITPYTGSAPTAAFWYNVRGIPRDFAFVYSGGGGHGGEYSHWGLGSHSTYGRHNQSDSPTYTTNSFTWGNQSLSIFSEASTFPFIPRDLSSNWADDYYPGPVFLPAFRGVAWDSTLNESTGHYPTTYGSGFLFDKATQTTFTNSGDSAAYTRDWKYWPQIDQEFYTDYGVQWGDMDKHRVPVLRSAMRTDTLNAIGTVLGWASYLDLETEPTWEKDPVGPLDENRFEEGRHPLLGPDRTFDTLFVGDMGTTLGATVTDVNLQRVFFTNPLVLGVPMRLGLISGEFTRGGPTYNGDLRDHVVRDIFDLMNRERELGTLQGGANGVKFLPLMNTFVAIKDQGLQSKLLWNSSFRVLHVRPGGGVRPGVGSSGEDHRQKVSSQPKSITELFMLRDRTRGNTIPMPDAPSAVNKPFLHFESMHPAAQGDLSPFNKHPNNVLLGHLYGMISDTLGGTALGVGGESDSLYNESATNHVVGPASWLLPEFATGVGGDTFIGDPFDFEYSKFNAENESVTNQVPKTDRLAANCGIELDLLNELRYAWDNKSDLNLDSDGSFGKCWLDLMPHPAELTAPGDHEIIFVLYPGSYGQKMLDETVPDGYNANVAGCHVVCSLEVNRPNEKMSSNDGGFGKHYGANIETYNIL